MVKKKTASIDEQIAQKREELTQAQITQTTAYSEYMKVMKAKAIVDEGDTEKIAKLDKLMFEHFTTYQHALEDAQKLQVELSDLEAQKYLEDLLSEQKGKKIIMEQIERTSKTFNSGGDFGMEKLSKSNELNESMSIAPQGRDEYESKLFNIGGTN